MIAFAMWLAVASEGGSMHGSQDDASPEPVKVVRVGQRISALRRLRATELAPSVPVAPTVYDLAPGSSWSAQIAASTMAPPPAAPPWKWAALLGAVAATAPLSVILRRRRKARSADATEIEVVATRACNAKHQLQVVVVDGHRLLLSVGPDRATLLCGLPDRSGAVPSFAQTLASASTEEPPSAEVVGILALKQARAQRTLAKGGA